MPCPPDPGPGLDKTGQFRHSDIQTLRRDLFPQAALYLVEQADSGPALFYLAQWRIRRRGRVRQPLLSSTFGAAAVDRRAALGRLQWLCRSIDDSAGVA